MTSVSSIIKIVEAGIPAGQMRYVRKKIPYYEQNRERGALFVRKGFDAWDFYVKWRPVLFVASLATMAASSYAWFKRNTKSVEANAVYPGSFTLAAVSAYLTRPRGIEQWFDPAAQPTDAQDQEPLTAWVDEEVAKLKAQDPDFADAALTRLVNTPAVKPTWRMAPRFAKELLI
jgi:hypothetical protein